MNFYEILGIWNAYPIEPELKYVTKIVYLQTYPESKTNNNILKKYIEQLVMLEIIEDFHMNDYEWGAQKCYQPKVATNWVIFLSEFWNINRQIK